MILVRFPSPHGCTILPLYSSPLEHPRVHVNVTIHVCGKLTSMRKSQMPCASGVICLLSCRVRMNYTDRHGPLRSTEWFAVADV